jgi:ribosomal protein S18 acetylase RimI-like enzyme
MSVRIDAATAEDADAVVDMWVSLANGQRSYGSHLAAEDNRKQIRDAVARHIVLDGLRVARPGDDSERPTGDSDGLESDLIGFVMFDLEAGTYVQDVSRGVVRNLYVRPAYRGDGVGRALLTTAEAALNDAGADVATLEAMATNERARSFYADQGYVLHRVEFEKPLGETEENDTHTRED